MPASDMVLFAPRNLNYWDSVSTLAGEVAHPRRTFPRALTIAVALVSCKLRLSVPVMPPMSSLPAASLQLQEAHNSSDVHRHTQVSFALRRTLS